MCKKWSTLCNKIIKIIKVCCSKELIFSKFLSCDNVKPLIQVVNARRKSKKDYAFLDHRPAYVGTECSPKTLTLILAKTKVKRYEFEVGSYMMRRKILEIDKGCGIFLMEQAMSMGTILC
ncbi:hypothetical protein VNO77_12552 [Canavalia gladiata]|uniref:Uncharacterized protein n=1 Tax=Canavalia gladiata TaxID=3824 RepID=A0AAN9LWE6_CANGL